MCRYRCPPGEGWVEGGANQTGGGIVLALNGAGSVTNRYLNGPNTSAYDQFFSTLAEENDTVTPAVVTWDLLDAEGSLRDVVSSTGAVLDHLNYDSFGNVTYESAPSVSHIDGYAGGLYDPSTGLVYFIHRWYDPQATVWISVDVKGFAAGDTNLRRYVSNSAANASDPTGGFEIDWVGVKWNTKTGAARGIFRYHQRMIEKAFKRIRKKLDVLIKNIDDEMAKRSECFKNYTVVIAGVKYGRLEDEVSKFRKVLVRLREGLDSDSEQLEVYQYDFPSQYGKFDSKWKLLKDANGEYLGEHMDAVAMAYPAIGFHDAELHLNAYSGTDPRLTSGNWMTLSNDRLDVLLFHELTHLYGTEDDDSEGPFMHIQSVENSINSGDFAHSSIYNFVRHRAQDACKEEYDEKPE